MKIVNRLKLWVLTFIHIKKGEPSIPMAGYIGLWRSTREHARLYGDSMALFINNTERRKMKGKICAAAPNCGICFFSNQCEMGAYGERIKRVPAWDRKLSGIQRPPHYVI